MSTGGEAATRRSDAAARPRLCATDRAALLRAHGFHAMALCYAASAGLVFLRVLASRSASFTFLPWNLTLAFFPYAASLIALLIDRSGRRRWPLVPLGLVALLFLPNSFYVATDLIHFRPREPVPVWYDIGLLALSVGTGWFMGLLSLRIWREISRERLGAAFAWAAIGVSSILCGYGIYLGRYLRFNSWDVVSAPGRVFAELARHILPPWEPEVAGVTAFFGALVFVTFLALELGRGRAVGERQAA